MFLDIDPSLRTKVIEKMGEDIVISPEKVASETMKLFQDETLTGAALVIRKDGSEFYEFPKFRAL